MKYVVLFVGHLYKPFRTIWVDRFGRGGQGRSKSAPEWPEFGLGAVQSPSNGSKTLKWTPYGPPKLALIDLSPFPDLSKHCSLYISKNINYLILLKISISKILTFTASNDRTRPFSYDLVIFLSVPHVGWLRKINKPWKKCIVWLVEVIKVTCIFYRILG